jgi:hypothetical protein
MCEIQRLLPAISILIDRGRVMGMFVPSSLIPINLPVSWLITSIFINDDHVGYGNFGNTLNT